MNILERLWDALDLLSFWTGFAANALWTGVLAIGVYWWRQRNVRRLRKRLATFERQRGRKEIALALAARGEDIEAAVRNFVGPDMPIIKVIKDKAFGEDEAEWLDFAREIRKRSSEIRQSGATRVHLFMSTPIPIGVFAGAILDGGPEVILHHFFSGEYRRVGTLAHEALVQR